jgi:carbamoyl-phosphate synthase small subunit
MSEAATETARAQANANASVRPPGADAALVLADGTVFWGRGAGAAGLTTGEVCFNTSITGYQEILTDPSYAGQIITFTFPHVGNVGTNVEDIETVTPAALGAVLRADITEPANWRAQKHLDAWLKSYNLPAVTGIDTRALTHRIRDVGFANASLIYTPGGVPDIAAAHAAAKSWPGLEGMDLAKQVTCRQTYTWDEATWTIRGGYGKLAAPARRVVAIDYGAKRNILRCLAATGCDVTVVPAETDAQSILRHKPDGIFLSNGPGDPAATGEYAVPVIKQLIEAKLPVFGICLGHQMLALALGAQTTKMHHGHRGANHPVKDLETGKVEITSQNHGFEVERASLPDGVKETHRSLFDGCLEGLRVEGKPIFSVQHHPEASPGPQDSHYLFNRFVKMIDESK